MKKLKLLWLISSGFMFLGLAGTASAISVDCSVAGCIGGVYTLDVISIGTDSYQATYTIDTSGAFSVDATTLNNVEFKVANDYSNVSVLSGPGGSILDGPLTGGGCGGNNDTFICVDLDPELAVGNSYTWTVTFSSTALISEDEWHVGARYTSTTHPRGWVISETDAGAIPEPTAALLFGAGLIVASKASRRNEV